MVIKRDIRCRNFICDGAYAKRDGNWVHKNYRWREKRKNRIFHWQEKGNRKKLALKSEERNTAIRGGTNQWNAQVSGSARTIGPTRKKGRGASKVRRFLDSPMVKNTGRLTPGKNKGVSGARSHLRGP